MSLFDAKPRSWEAYLAGIGASGVLMASALVLFVILVGVVTFKTWPQTGGALLGDGGGDVALERTATPAPRDTAGAPGVNLVKLLGGTGQAAPGQGRGAPRGTGNSQAPGDIGSPGGSTGPGSVGGQPQGAAPPPPASRANDPVTQLVAGAGNTVQSTTDSLGKTLGDNVSPGLGGLVSGVGKSLNDNLQSVTGKH